MPKQDTWKQETKRRAAEREREKDTIHFLEFFPKDERKVSRTTLLDDPWCVKLPGNPSANSLFVDAAIKVFEAEHQVQSWSEVASRYQTNSICYP